MKLPLQISCLRFASIWVTLVGFTVSAQETEHTELRLVADEFKGSLEGGAVATGNVVLEQGEIKLIAEKLSLEVIDGSLASAVAEGEPAQIQFQLGEDDDVQTIEAEATTIRFNPVENWIEFEGTAKVQNPRLELTGEKIRIDITSNRLEAESLDSGEQVKFKLRDPQEAPIETTNEDT